MGKERMAGRRMFSRKQIDKHANVAQQRRASAPDPVPSDQISDALWQSLLDDPADKPMLG